MRRRLTRVLGVIAIVMLPTQAIAGGWAVVSIEDHPGSLHAGTAHIIEFTVLGHGVTPTSGWGPLEAVFRLGSKEHRFPAMGVSKGVYTVEVMLDAGEWSWSVRQVGGIELQAMGSMPVTNSQAEHVAGPSRDAALVILMLVGAAFAAVVAYTGARSSRPSTATEAS